MPVKRDDKSIVDLTKRRQQKNDQKVLEHLFNEHHTPLRAFLKRRLVPVDERDDVIQEVFARLAKMRDLGKTWFYPGLTDSQLRAV